MNSGGGDGGAAASQVAEQNRENAINSGTASINNIFGQFDDNFYNKQKQNYLDYATPQLNDQYADAQKQMTFSLARNGNLDSTARNTQQASLSKLYDTNKTGVDNQALDYENTARNNVNSAKTGLINNLSATGDAAGATNAANSNAVALSQPQAYSPLSQLFSTFTSGLSTQAQLEALGAYSGGAISPTFQTGLFGGSSGGGAVKVS